MLRWTGGWQRRSPASRAERAFVTGYPHRTQFAWVAGLALAWLAFSSPWSATWNLLLAAIVIALVLLAILVVTRRLRTSRRPAEPVLRAVRTSLDTLPGDLRRNTPLVLVAGATAGAQARAFGEAWVRITDTALWVRVDDPTRLAHVADALKRWREGQGPDAVACLAGADQANDTGALQAGLGRWRSAIGEASRAVGYPLPICLAVYAEEAEGPPDDCPWFGISGSEVPQGDSLSAVIATRALSYALCAVPADREARMYRGARLDALARWATGAVLPAFADSPRDGIRHARSLTVSAFGVTLVAGVRPADSSLAHFTRQATELNALAGGGRRAACSLPEPLLRGITPQPVQRTLTRALAHAGAWLALAFCAAYAASASQNRALVARVTADMARYRAIGPGHDAARVDALESIKRDRDELEQYASAGVPPRLGFGFYRGTPLLAPLNALIAAYQPPAPPPSTIELDSLSLFRSGSVVLNPGSNVS